MSAVKIQLYKDDGNDTAFCLDDGQERWHSRTSEVPQELWEEYQAAIDEMYRLKESLLTYFGQKGE